MAWDAKSSWRPGEAGLAAGPSSSDAHYDLSDDPFEDEHPSRRLTDWPGDLEDRLERRRICRALRVWDRHQLAQELRTLVSSHECGFQPFGLVFFAGFLPSWHPVLHFSLWADPLVKSAHNHWRSPACVCGCETADLDLHFLFGRVDSGPLCTAASAPRRAYFRAVKRAFRMHHLDSLYAALRTASPRVRAAFLLGSPASLPHSLRPALSSNLQGSLPAALQSQLPLLWINAFGEWSAQQRPL